MAITPRMRELGLLTPNEARRSSPKAPRRHMLASEGRANTGKTEFLLSCPGPGAIVACDRGFDGLFDNPNPPPSRRDDFGIQVMHMKTNNTSKGVAGSDKAKDEYAASYQAFYRAVSSYLDEPSLRTVAIDGDNVSWEVQRLAEHGKLTQVYPATKFGDVKAARRGFYHKLWDSGKFIVTTNMVQEEWTDVLDQNGLPTKDDMGENKRAPSGNYKAQGFPDQEYLWTIRIRHLYQPSSFSKKFKRDIPRKWGLKILMCKANRDMEGSELWGDDATCSGLMQAVYPNIPLAEWGF